MFITVDNATLFAAAFGPKMSVPILALGGWIGSWEDWLEPLSILSESQRVIAFDHRGCGISLAPVESITFDRLVDDVFAVLDAYDAQRCVLAAMSMGAAVALGAALKHPDRIAALVLVNPLDLSAQPAGDADPFLRALTYDYPRALQGFIEACIVEPDSAHLKHWGWHILNRASQDAAIALYRMSQSISFGSALARVTQPTLIIHGESDGLVPLESARWLAETLPDARLEVIEGAGHVPVLTRPVEVAREIAWFINEIDE
ncbi:MAG: alpha/beta hydrolase [Chloroflexi bacterium]|nr:alpha/beta hydrolase [Chloroflexota bacterium]